MSTKLLKTILAVAVTGVLLGWIALMVSFWLPTQYAQDALSATALCLLVPFGITAGVISVAWEELQAISFSTKQPKMRCIDCGTKILSAAGTTVGDEIEGEIMTSQWTPPRSSPFKPNGGPMA